VETSIFCFATDLADEGIETVLENVAVRAGLGGVTVAAAYHDGRDVFPHNPRHAVRFLESGAVFFPPDEVARGRLRPAVSEAADALPAAVAAAGGHGLTVRAWTVFLHNGALAAEHPDCAPENAFGDRYVTDLCPAHPDVRAYARALAADVARLGVTTICAESLHFHPLEHGHAHERYFVELAPRVRHLLGLCFCEHCLAAAPDGEAARRLARDEIERAFAGRADDRGGGELERDELLGYTAARERTVTTLVAEVAAAAGAHGAAVEFIDLSGATKGYATGRPTGAPARATAWQAGVDVSAVARACDGIEAVAYAADVDRVCEDLDAYGDDAVSVILRPTGPDCDGPDNLRAKVEFVRRRGLRRVDFYHYGLMPLAALDVVRAALEP
jgi:hypothetical protein